MLWPNIEYFLNLNKVENFSQKKPRGLLLAKKSLVRKVLTYVGNYME